MATTTAPHPLQASIDASALDGYRTMLRMAVPATEGGPDDAEREKVRSRLRAAQSPNASPMERAFYSAFLEVNRLAQDRNALREALAAEKAALATLHESATTTAQALASIQALVRDFLTQIQPHLGA